MIGIGQGQGLRTRMLGEMGWCGGGGEQEKEDRKTRSAP